MNLCANSAHAMREQGGVLEVRLENVHIDPDIVAGHRDAEPGPYLRLTVADTGHGITEEAKLRIFEPYFTTKDVGEGTGLGLATVYGIVKSYRGFILVTSEPGLGTAFDIFLPRIESAPVVTKGDATPIPTGHGRVLLVDDEEALVAMEQRMLERIGYEVVGMSNSIDALEAFKNEPHHFDLVVTDQTMPHMTGAELAREILKIRSDMPILLCTGFSETITEEKAEAIGIRRLIMKPVATKELARAVSELLGGKQVGL
jgi:CheY-like chemotaxis protein